MLSFILLSDIHFRRFRQSASDLDVNIRNEILIDADERLAETGPVHGVIVCGDVAFSGEKTEYDVARHFLQDLCKRVKCPPENVWMVPGNHDVDRSVISRSFLLQGVHASLRNGNVDYLDSNLRRYVEDEQARELVLSPLEHYNLFAAGYGSGCAVNSERFYWEHDLPLNDGSVLRIRGINSTLVSGPQDDNQANKLIVGQMQTQMLREDGVTFMTLCHHPIDWLMDSDAVTDALNQRASIQIFGHKHRQRVTLVQDKSLIISSGALQPTRGETGWIPTYNILSLTVDGNSDARYLNVELRTRRWNEAEGCFVAEVGEGDVLVRQARIKLRRWSAVHSVDNLPVETEECPVVPYLQERDGSPKDINAKASKDREEVSLMVNPERRLMFRFFSLPYNQIILIASSLDLTIADDQGVKDAERFQRYFRRADERGQLSDLWKLVEKHYGEGLEDKNPFLPSVSTLVQP